MKALFIVPFGLEEVANRELEGKVISKSLVSKDYQSYEDMLRDTYVSRSIYRSMILVEEGKFNSLEDIYELFLNVDWKHFFHRGCTFACRCIRRGKHTFSSMDVERLCGKAILEKVKGISVHLNSPDVIVRSIVDGDRIYVGMDLVGYRALDKRMYRAFNHRSALDPVIAYNMCILASPQENQRILDPMCGGATLLIECCHRLKNVPAGFFRKNELAFLRLPFLSYMNFGKLFKSWDERINWEAKVDIVGRDISPKVVKNALYNLRRSMCEEIRVELGDIFKEGMDASVLVSNPPYGYREGSLKKALRIHEHLRRLVEGRRFVIITPHVDYFKGYPFYRTLSGGLELYVVHRIS